MYKKVSWEFIDKSQRFVAQSGKTTLQGLGNSEMDSFTFHNPRYQYSYLHAETKDITCTAS